MEQVTVGWPRYDAREKMPEPQMDRSRTSDKRAVDGDHPAVAPVAALVPGPEEPLRVGDVATVIELAAQLEQAGHRERALREHLHQVHLQLADRDVLIEQLVSVPGTAHGLSADLAAERQARRQDRERSDEERAHLAAALAGAQERLAAVEATRAWRAARRWYRVKERFRVG